MSDVRRIESAPSVHIASLGRSLARAVSQVSLTLGRGEQVFNEARQEVLRWLAGRAGRPLPREAWDGAPFELEEIGAQHTEAVSIITPRFWAARLDDADKQVPSRTWVTEAALGERPDGVVVFGARLTAAVRHQEVPFERSIPGFVRQIAVAQEAYLDGRRVEEAPWLVSEEQDVDELVGLLCDPARRVDVIVAALAEASTDPSTALLNLGEIARRTIGAAHVVAITGPASFHLSDRLGREFSVYRQAVRTYRPKFDPNLDEPFAHPLGLPHRILDWPGGGLLAYTRLLVSQALTRSVSSADIEQLVPSFLVVKRTAAQLRLEQARETGSSEADLLALYQNDNEDLRRQLREEKEKGDALLSIAEAERDTAMAAAQQARETAKHLRLRVESLQRAGSGSPSRSQTLPSSLEAVQSWCEENLAGAVEMHSRAYRGLKDSEYHDVALIYRALLLLRDDYVPMRREGGADRQEAFRKACDALGVQEEATGSETRAGEEGEEYYIRYAGRRVYMDRHLKKGASRERRHCFRLYFFWDDETDQVVVGWLPSHLTSRIS